jgi:hypothetical protein
MCLRVSYKKKYEKAKNFCILKSLKKVVGSGTGFRVGSGSVSQMFGSKDPDPNSHQNVRDPQHWRALYLKSGFASEANCLSLR